MSNLICSRATIFNNLNLKTSIRTYKNLRYSHKWCSKNTRQQFLDYFIKENDHNFIRSSPVMPFCDPTVAFVNAGMNQFKGIFLGHQEPKFTKVANSQKCVRVGGKHNDLSIVGTDGFHHTFFEMLGSWSFDDYFKKEACELAWNLLTGPYGLQPSNLYVTYFAGDQKLQLVPDLECKDIWRTIGVSEDRIIPFGLKDNFWEMGTTGPCGPCTEIHIDHTKSTRTRSQDVNRDLPDLTELWNIVFIQYNRNENGVIENLPKKHIDTGMGLERLTAVLQGKSSNYDTDIFTNLFEMIQKNCHGLPKYNGKYGSNDLNDIDASYRILADHARTITVCLADGMIPEQNQKLRKILRKSLYIAETVFKKEKDLLNELSYAIAENLGETYPEILKNIKQVNEIISYEEEIFKSIRRTASKEWDIIVYNEPRLNNLDAIETPGLITAYNDICTSNVTKITPDLAFRLYDTHGLDEETITKLAQALNLPFKSEELKTELKNARNRTKEQYMLNNNLTKITEIFKFPKTKDSGKYEYIKQNNEYKFKNLNVKVLSIIKNNKIVENISADTECYLILDETILYTESGGQISDTGRIIFSPDKEFVVTDVLNVNGYMFHKGKLQANTDLIINDQGILSVDETIRIQTMANHTATHLVNAAIKNVLKSATCQKSSKVNDKHLNFDVGIYSKKLSMEDIENVENLIRKIIRNSVPVQTKLINSQELLSLDHVTMLPGEVYPDDGIRLITIKDENSELFSCEPCCGTHVLNTSDIKDICITNSRSLGRSTVSLTAVTQDEAILAQKNGQNMLQTIMKFQENKIGTSEELKLIDDTIAEIRHRLLHGNENEDLMPIYVKTQCLNILNEFSKQLRGAERGHLKDYINVEMKTVLETNQNKTKNNHSFIVHFLGCSSILDDVPLQHATRMCSNMPVLVLSYSDNMVKARCCVPKNSTSDNFNAELWLKNTVAEVFKTSYSAPRGQDGALVVNMRTKKINTNDWEKLLHKALSSAKKFANEYL